MVGFQTSFFFLICLSNTVESYPLICPSPSEWRLRSDSFSNCTSRDYMCLYNRTSDSNSELCGNPEAYHKGVKLIWNGNVDAANCSTDRFQPFNFRTNESSTCVFLKSTCQEEGQLKNDTGSGLKDVKCICDEEKGFRFLHTPINKNFCISSEEDCTCFSNAKVENAGLTEDVKRPNITSQLSQQQNYTEYNQDGVVMITIVIVLVLGICISMMVWLCTIVSDVKLCVNNDQSSSVVSTKDTMALLDHEDVKVKTGEDVDAEQATSSTVESNTLSNKKYPHDMYRKNENSEYPTGGIVAIQPRKEQEQTPVVRTCGKLMQSDDNDGKGQSKRLNNELDREQILLELLDTKREYWREQEKLFYETSFVQDIMHSFRFRDCHSKLLIGSMSSGKSVTAAHIALQFETLKYTIFFI